MERARTNKANFELSWAKKSSEVQKVPGQTKPTLRAVGLACFPNMGKSQERAGTNKANFEIC